ncbi:peroxisomal N(1)-acetyl-spermine spermidine oxidase [Pelobates cultripes]|uniref:Amine oxidase n=1 Tax=Pelobates cultripes TaxID=61616 RepID=A0AAD1TEK7_PELCU|nr:peroxisomal N(1)-acetyl-spermine spermidine oxidase [Pelobates cultripes]
MKIIVSRPRLLLIIVSLCTLPSTISKAMGSESRQPMASQPPAVLIIGSGISGIAAAQKLYAHGFRNLKVLEAKGRTGGRIWSQSYGKGFVELGAQWIHGPSPGNPIYQLALKYDLLDPEAMTMENQKVKVDGHLPLFRISYSSSGKIVSRELVANITELYSSWLEQSQSVSQKDCDPKASVGGFLQQKIASKEKDWDSANKDMKLALFKGLLDLECCISGTHSMNYVALCLYGEYTMLPGLDCTFPGGFESIVNQLKSSLPNDTILLNKTVKTVHWNGTFQGSDSQMYPVQVQCEDGETFEADHVIVTVSLGFLKEKASSFLSPALPPNKAQAIQNVGFGTNNKIILEFKEPFWDPDCKTIQLIWEGESPLLETKRNMKQDWVKKIPGFVVLERPERIGHMLCSFIAGDESEYMETLTDDEVLSSMTALLRQFTGNPELPAPIHMFRTKWHSEPYTHGSYSYIAVGASGDDIDILAQPLPNEGAKPLQVLFAGEATHRSFYSTTHGALLSGWREAERLIGRYQELDSLLNKSKL